MMFYKKIQRVNYINALLTILSLTVILDSINGFLTMYGPGNLNFLIPLVRCILILFFIVMIVEYSRKLGLIILSLSFLLFALTNIVTILYGFNDKEIVKMLIENNIYISKFMYFLSLTSLLILFVVKKNLTINQILNVIKNNAYAMPLLIIVPTIFGINRETYANSGLGSSGFFISNNSTNFVMVLSVAFLLYLISTKFEEKKPHFFFLLSLGALSLQGSKTSYLFIMVYLAIYVYCLIRMGSVKQRMRSIDKKMKIIMAIFGSFFFVGVYNSLSKILLPFFQRQIYQFEQQGYSIVAYLNSGRTFFLNTNIEYIKTRPMFLLTGVGSFNLKNTTGHLSEMDFFDILFISGILGILMTYGIVLYALYKLIKTQYKYTNLKKLLLFALLFSLFFSFFAGHVFVDAISLTFISLFISLVFVESIEKEKE